MFGVQESAEGDVEGITVSTERGRALDIDKQLATLAEQ
jgi:hypothetical protein